MRSVTVIRGHCVYLKTRHYKFAQ